MIGLLWLTTAGWAGPIADGAAAFDDGRLDDAIAAWQGEEGAPSGVAQYDLGVAYYRKGDLPRAIAAFRGAARLRPRDPWVHHNLALARSGLAGLPDPVGGDGWGRIATPGELGVLGVLVTAFGSFAMLLGRTRPVGTAIWLVGLVVGGVAAAGARWDTQHPVAVVVDAEAVLRDAATVAGGERYRLPPGAEVRVQQRFDDYLLVEDARARRGWVPRNAVALAWDGAIGR